MKKLNAKKAAKELIEAGYDLGVCQAVQDERIRRLKFWQEKGIDFMAKKEKELIAFGEEYLTILTNHKLSQENEAN